MSEFTPITTQEQFDEAIKERLSRERKTVEEKYSDYAGLKKRAEDAEKKAGDLEQKTGDLEKKVKGYESDSLKIRVAHETGLPYEMAGRLKGEDEKAIREDAKALVKLMGGHKTPPLHTDEPGGSSAAQGGNLRSAYKALNDGLKGE